MLDRCLALPTIPLSGVERGRRPWVLGILAALAGLLLASPQARAATVEAGAASADITPPIGTPMFGYTGRSGVANPSAGLQIIADPDKGLYAKSFVPSEGLHTRVLSRALVLRSGGTKFALVQVDLGGLPFDLVQEVLKRIESTGISGDRLLISATHTHSSTGPLYPPGDDAYAVLGGDAFDPRVFDITAEGITESILAADANLVPARIGIGNSTIDDASVNRSFAQFLRNGDVPKDPAAARAASTDPGVTVIRVDDLQGRPVAVWSSFAIHPVSLGPNLLFSGDNAGAAERYVEAEITKRATDLGKAPARPVLNLWTNANSGDLNPADAPNQVDGLEDPADYVPQGGGYPAADVTGRRVGRGILRAWEDAEAGMSEEAPIKARRTFFTFDGTEARGEPVGPLAAYGAGGTFGSPGTCAPTENFAGPGQGFKQPIVEGVGIVPSTSPLSVWRIGPLGIAAFPTEITKQMGVRIRAALEGAAGTQLDQFVTTALTNSYVSYTATFEEYDACFYEGSSTLFGRSQGNRLLDVALPISEALLGDRPAPAGSPEPPQTAVAEGGQTSPPRETPDAGKPVQQPARSVDRYDRAVFSWHGGDPGIDVRRGETFVTVERDASDQNQEPRWEPVSTDDSPADTVSVDAEDVWTEVYQFDHCAPTGSYRFVVTGNANRGLGLEPYRLVSDAFELQALSIALGDVQVSNGTALVRATYPDPGPQALLALPRLVRSGQAALRVTPSEGEPRTVIVDVDHDLAAFTIDVEEGSEVEVLGVRDGCGNTGGAAPPPPKSGEPDPVDDPGTPGGGNGGDGTGGGGTGGGGAGGGNGGGGGTGGNDGNGNGNGNGANGANQPSAPARCAYTLSSADSTQAGTDDGETLLGTPGNDVINGNGGRDTVVGLAGADCLTGDDAFDTIRGKSGDDVATGGQGRDFMKGNGGDDFFTGGQGKDRIRLAGGKDEGRGQGGNDNISTGGGKDRINGGPGNDRLFGNAGNDQIRGGNGNDVLFGGGGNHNVLRGGPGRDRCIVVSRANNETRGCEKVLVGGARG